MNPDGLTKIHLRLALEESYIQLAYRRLNMQTPSQRFPDWGSRSIIPGLRGRGKLRPHSGHKGGAPVPLFAAGEAVRETGIYEVIHDRAHRSVHEVVMLSGNSFPACDTCGEQVHFRLIRTAPYIFQDEDFEEGE